MPNSYSSKSQIPKTPTKPNAHSDHGELFDPTRLIIGSGQVASQRKQERSDDDAEEIGDGVFSGGAGGVEEAELVGELLGGAG